MGYNLYSGCLYVDKTRERMVILEIAQWGLLLYLAWILYQCYKTLKSMVELESTVRKHFQDEFKSIYEILNKIKNE